MTEERWDLPPTWSWAAMGEVAEVVGGGTPPASDETNFAEKGIAWLTPADLTGYEDVYITRGRRDLSGKGYRASAARIMPSGTVLFSSRAPVGYCAIASDEISTNQGFKSFVLKGELSPEYVRHYLLGSVDYAESKASGTTFKELSGSRAAELAIPIAPLSEQRRIVAKIDSVTGRSRRARDHLDHIPRLVEKYKQAVLARLLASPDGQQVTRFGEVAKMLNGDRGQNYPSDSEQLPQGYCLFLGTRNVRQGFFDFYQTSFVTREKHLGLRGGTMEYGDIVITVRGTLGNCAVYDSSVPFAPIRINSAMMIIRPVADADPEYLMWTIRSPVFLEWVRENSRGSAQPHLRARDIEETEIYFPRKEGQKAVVRRIKAAFDWIDRLASDATRARRLINHLDRAVLAKAFRGELVPQDPNDEPASVLLERIRADRAAAPKSRRGRTVSAT